MFTVLVKTNDKTNLLRRTLSKMPPFNYKPKPYTGDSYEVALKKRRAYVHPSVELYYDKPLMIVEGKKQYLFDEKGRRYLDAIAGISVINCGHCHPKIVKATTDQLNTLQHTTTLYLNNMYTNYAEKLLKTLPKKLDTVYFVNSGSEATTLAMNMCRTYTNNWDMISLRGGYHGMGASMGLTANSHYKQPLPQGFGIKHVRSPNPYRGPYLEDDPNMVDKYVNEIHDLIQCGTCGEVAGFIAEPIQGVAGGIPLPKGYLKKAFEVVRKAGGICIADEVQDGFGRTGTMWGFQKDEDGLEPDIITMAKGIGNGFPLGAVVTTKEIANSFTKRFHFNTFGGNPVAMAVGNAVLDVIEEENLIENARVLGKYLKGKLTKLMDKHDVIGNVRGKGLMIGVELVKDRKTKEPGCQITLDILENMKELGVLTLIAGVYSNVLRIKPPLCITKEDADFIVDVFDEAIQML
ncbi:alanine--glyoxylate aminotransferase 2 [Anaeramoeba flamelloides]|uniref:alanine--glyoxylate transaminase n=1 Tax=Anaeramoeba flamelloides TaxID=1746091 RepID=A0ABQ8ZAA6_9EUKA|nr:alanine--glyoxylate aminotransferase 2 [Anaeramoeba flamelloides]